MSGDNREGMGKMFSMQNWLQAWIRVKAKGTPSVAFGYMKSPYTSSERAYHKASHIAHCLYEFESARHLAQDANAVELALWFHDVVYVPGNKDNEEKSAEFARDLMLRNMGLPEALVDRVAELILTTRHGAELPDTDSQLIHDIDYSILGMPDEEFDRYCLAIRDEFADIPDEAFARGRADFLRGVLEHLPVYVTDFFRKKYEQKAEANVARELERLTQS